MQKSAQYRLIYFVLMVATFAGGYYFLPDTIRLPQDKWLTALFAGLYFIILPAAYYVCVVVKGKQKLWKIIISFSLAAVAARYTFPEDLAAYFEFISWLRYPIAAVLIILEFALVYMVVKSLWKARHLPGDPRLHAHKAYAEDDKKRMTAVLWAHEPASWFYAIPRFTRRHVSPVGKLHTKSDSVIYQCVLTGGIVLAAALSYWLLAEWSHTAAVIVCSLILWTMISAIASIRIGKHFSLYIQDDDLVINPGFYSTLFARLSAIESAEAGSWSRADCGDALILGQGDEANVRIRFSKPALLYSMMATFEDWQDEVYLICRDPQQVADSLKPAMALPAA